MEGGRVAVLLGMRLKTQYLLFVVERVWLWQCVAVCEVRTALSPAA